MKVNETSAPTVRVCPDATVSVNLLLVSSQAPVNFALSAPPRTMVPVVALAPVSAVMVTKEAAKRFTFDCSVTVIVLVAALTRGVLWPIFMVENVGTTIKRGFAPPVTPSRSVPGRVIAAAANVAVPEAAMLGVAAF